MAYKTILNVVGMDRGDRDLERAVELCGQAGAHLSVLVLGLSAPPPMGDAVMMADSWVEERQADLARLEGRVASIRQVLAGSSLSADVSSDYVDLSYVDDVVGRRARYADIVVVGPEMLASDPLKAKVVEGTLFSSGRPVLLLPETSRATLRLKRMLVAWDSSLEATRALRESLDLLDADTEVHLVMVDPVAGEIGQGAEPGADVAAYLARRGVKVTVDRLPSSGRSIADVLSRHAVDMSADLLVMGAYGHSRLRERIFGGVTRTMLEEPPLPVLMAR